MEDIFGEIIETEEMEYRAEPALWDTGFFDKDGKKMETEEVIAVLLKKIVKLENRVNELEDFYNSTDWDDLKCTVDSLDRTSVRRRSYY